MISAFVITGFLGSGKTTFMLNTIRKYFQDNKIAIIVNEIGDIGVDGKILKNVYSNVLELSEGCICCSLSAEFEKGVHEILERYDPEFLFVETSGTSEPFPIMLSLQNLGVLLEGIICIVDAKNFKNYKENPTFKYQIGSSNIIIINKIDLANDIDKVEQEIHIIKQEYNIKDMITQKPLFKHYKIYKSRFGELNEDIFKDTYPIKNLPNIPANLEHLEHIKKYVMFIKKEISYKELDDILKKVPENIFRIKGILKLKDSDKSMLLNYTFGYSELQPIDYEGDSFLVLIGKNIDEKNLFMIK